MNQAKIDYGQMRMNSPCMNNVNSQEQNSAVLNLGRGISNLRFQLYLDQPQDLIVLRREINNSSNNTIRSKV